MGEACEPVGLRRGCGLARDRKESGQKEQKHSFLEATTRRRTSLPRVSGTLCMGHGAEHTAGPRPALPGVPADTPRPKELCGAPRSLRLQHGAGSPELSPAPYSAWLSYQAVVLQGCPRNSQGQQDVHKSSSEQRALKRRINWYLMQLFHIQYNAARRLFTRYYPPKRSCGCTHKHTDTA